jgi:hypothetical protein
MKASNSRAATKHCVPETKSRATEETTAAKDRAACMHENGRAGVVARAATRTTRVPPEGAAAHHQAVTPGIRGWVAQQERKVSCCQ